MLQPARTIATALAAFLLASPALAAPPGLSEAQSIALGRALAVRNCGMCHAVERTGAPSRHPRPPPGRPAPGAWATPSTPPAPAPPGPPRRSASFTGAWTSRCWAKA